MNKKIMPEILKLIKEITIPALMEFGDPALEYFTKQDLVGEDPGDITHLWELPDVRKILDKQSSDGSWPYPKRAKAVHPTENYHILQTFRTLGYLIEMYGLDKTHPAIDRAAEFLLAQQTEEGDIRGIFGSQYAPHYTAGILELLIKAGVGMTRGLRDLFSGMRIHARMMGGGPGRSGLQRLSTRMR